MRWRTSVHVPNNGLTRKTWGDIPKRHAYAGRTWGLPGRRRPLTPACAGARPSPGYAHMRARVHPKLAGRGVSECPSAPPPPRPQLGAGTCAHAHPGRASPHANACAPPPPTCRASAFPAGRHAHTAPREREPAPGAARGGREGPARGGREAWRPTSRRSP